MPYDEHMHDWLDNRPPRDLPDVDEDHGPLVECPWCGEPTDEYAPCHAEDDGGQARDEDERALDADDFRAHILGNDWED